MMMISLKNMRKKIRIIGLLIVCIGCADRELEKPKIKSLTILTKIYPLWSGRHQAEEIKNKDTLYLKHYEEFDSLGNVIVEKVRDADVRHDIYYRNNYDTTGTLESRESSPRNDFKRSSLDFYIYNSRKQLIKEFNVGRNADTTSMYIYEYNEKGQKISKLDLDPYGHSERYEYTDQNLIKETGDFHQCFFFYNDRNQLVKQILFYDNPDTVSAKTYKYNTLGQVAQITTYYYETKATSVERISYNSYGDIGEKIIDGEKWIYVYQYFK